jgi:uncharacterized repeat protein (TIGR01451 family)
MSVFRVARLFAFLIIGWLLALTQARAQGLILNASSSTNLVLLNNPFSYSISLTNFTAITIPGVFVTNTFSAPVTILSATNSLGPVVTNGNTLIYSIGPMIPGQFAQMAATVVPTQVGLLTNFIVAAAPATALSNTVSNVVVTVTNLISLADLAVSISGPAAGVFVGDQLTIITTVSNGGPTSVTNVSVTNVFSDGVVFSSSSPSNFVTVTSNIFTFFLGVSTNHQVKTTTLHVQPTNAGVLTILASAGAPSGIDTNTANNFASTNIPINAFTGQLVAVTNSPQTFNPQTGFLEQTVMVSNVGTTAVASVRVVVTGLTNLLYNAVGVNGGNPYVVYPNTLDTNQSVTLLLEFFNPSRVPFPLSNAQLQALGAGTVDLTSPGGTNGSFAITGPVLLPSGGLLIEFQSIPGHTYSVLYSDDMSFTNTLVAQPSIVAQADRVQWIDDGPPKTISVPASVSSRFYRVLLIQ